MTKRKRTQRCVCGLPMPHAPIPPGQAWPHTDAPAEVIAAGHYAHAPTEYCQCAVCNSLR
jgi:hypothetical protein